MVCDSCLDFLTFKVDDRSHFYIIIYKLCKIKESPPLVSRVLALSGYPEEAWFRGMLIEDKSMK